MTQQRPTSQTSGTWAYDSSSNRVSPCRIPPELSDISSHDMDHSHQVFVSKSSLLDCGDGRKDRQTASHESCTHSHVVRERERGSLVSHLILGIEMTPAGPLDKQQQSNQPLDRQCMLAMCLNSVFVTSEAAIQSLHPFLPS